MGVHPKTMCQISFNTTDKVQGMQIFLSVWGIYVIIIDRIKETPHSRYQFSK